MVAVVSHFEPPDALVNLRYQVLTRQPPTGAETSVVAKGAASDGDGAIDVRTGEPGVDTHLLNSVAETAAKKMVIGVVAKTCGPPSRLGRTILDGG
jgi:CTP:molybdopterin cytidylyltransferase MocA